MTIKMICIQKLLEQLGIENHDFTASDINLTDCKKTRRASQPSIKPACPICFSRAYAVQRIYITAKRRRLTKARTIGH
jgi:hypothetical protein